MKTIPINSTQNNLSESFKLNQNNFTYDKKGGENKIKNKKTIQFFGISLALVMLIGSVPLGYSEPLRVQLEHGIDADQLQCGNPNHVLVQRTNGNMACVTERTVDRTGWEIIIQTEKLATDLDLSPQTFEPYDPGEYPIRGHLPTDVLKRGPAPQTIAEDSTPDFNIINGVIILPTIQLDATPKVSTLTDIVYHGKSTLSPLDWVPTYIPNGMELTVGQWKGDFATYGNDWVQFVYVPNTSELTVDSYKHEFLETHYIDIAVRTTTYETQDEVNAWYGVSVKQNSDLNETRTIDYPMINGKVILTIAGDPLKGETSGIQYIDTDLGVNIKINSNRYDVSELVKIVESMPEVKNTAQ